MGAKTISNEKKINICLAADENYIKYLIVTIISILKNADKQDEFSFYILCNDICDNSKEIILNLGRKKKCMFHFVDVDIKNFEQYPKGGEHITNTTYFRYKIAEFLPNVDKIIYLDCDVIVKKSLRNIM